MKKIYKLLPLLAAMTLAGCNSGVEPSSSSSTSSSTSTTQSSEPTSTTTTSTSTSTTPVTPATDEDKAVAIALLTEAFNDLDIDEYSQVRWDSLVKKLNDAIAAIRAATSLEQINEAKAGALSYFASCPKASDIVKDTWFDYHSPDSNYEFDRDDNNHLTISYDGYPGHWVYCGTKHLVTDTTENNVLSLTFSNDIDEGIEVCLQATSSAKSGYKLDSQVVNVAAKEVKTIELRYDIEIDSLYFFIDSCSNHTRKGHVTILEQKLYYEDRSPSQIFEAKDINMNYASLVKDDGGVNTGYTLTEEDHPLFISRVAAILRVDYHGNGDGAKWFGLNFKAGSNFLQVSDSIGHAQEEKIDGTETGKDKILFNLPIDGDKKLTTGEKLSLNVAYMADEAHCGAQYKADITFELIGYRFTYTLWDPIDTETVEVNQKCYDGGVNNKVSVPYSSFTKKGRVNRMDITFETVNTEDYGKSQVYIKGFNFTEFPTGNNNVLNIGPIMDKSGSGTPTTGTMSVYPINEVDLKQEGGISFECWWASASDITVKSIKMYTDNMSAPDPVRNLEANPIDSGVVLEWASSKNANVYEIYQGDEKIGETTSTFYRIEGLVNNQTYTFGVKARNGAGASDMVTVNGTPEEGATYDEFIGGLNTDLEEMIGSEGIASMFNQSLYYLNESNNERFKSKIEAMQNGEEVKVAFMGGSITVGETAALHDEHNHAKGYAYYTYQWLKKNFDVENKSSFHNASISGTGSEIGIVRAEKDMIEHNPDIIFIEFAANNGSSNFCKQSYESLIRKCLALPSNPCVVLLFSATYYSGSTEQYMSAIGSHYGLPMFSLDKGLKQVCTILDEHGHLTREDPIYAAYSDDGTHPNDNGHQLYAKCLAYYLKELSKKEKDEPYDTHISPSQANYDKFETLVAVDHDSVNGEITSLGSFAAANTATPSTSLQSDVTAFQQGWKKTSTSENNAMVIEVKAKNFIFIYECGNPSVAGDPKGNIIVTYQNKNNTDDKGTLTWDTTKTCGQNNDSDLTEISERGSGWQNPAAILVFDKTSVDDYIITLKMDSDAGLATIMAFGYSI